MQITQWRNFGRRIGRGKHFGNLYSSSLSSLFLGYGARDTTTCDTDTPSLVWRTEMIRILKLPSQPFPHVRPCFVFSSRLAADGTSTDTVLDVSIGQLMCLIAHLLVLMLRARQTMHMRMIASET
jgi:hypothetical protein